LPWLLAVLLAPLVAHAQNEIGPVDRDLSNAVIDMLEAPPLPPISVSPTHRHALLIHEHALLPIRNLAEPMLEIGHLRVNPAAYGPHAPLSYYGLTQIDLETNESVRIALPPDVTLSFPRWAPDGLRYAFTVTRDTGIELWIGDPDEDRVRKILGPVLNATTGTPCTWMPDGRRLLCRTVPQSRRTTDPILLSPYLQRTRQPMRPQPARLGTGLVAQLLEAQLEIIDVVSGNRRNIGSPMAFESVEPAPGGAYLLVQRMTAPYPRAEANNAATRVTEVWDITGRSIRTFGGAAAAPRALQWHTSRMATLVWAEDAGDTQRVVAQAAPFLAEPIELFRPEHRFAGLAWLEDARGTIVRDYNPATRSTSLWLIGDDGAEAVRLADRSIDSRTTGVGTPVTHVNAFGQIVVRTQGDGIFLRGQTPDGERTRHFLDYLDLSTQRPKRLWESSGRHYEPIVELLARDGSLLLTRRENADEPPNYVLHDLARRTETKITQFGHPAPSLHAAHRIPLRYTRPDGRELSSVLYVPADASPEQPLPVVMWAYPREFGADIESVVLSSPERFLDFKRAFRLFFLLRGYGVMDEVAMPIIGNPGEANDTFIEQIVANAQAALDAAANTGLIDPRNAGIAGHSYGAFMVANLLAHSRLFGAGVAMSGAYNRTLTPFGFQTERRSLWEAPEMYMAMSPFLFSNRIDAPLLLVHGLLDNNAGTQPSQSQQFYNAIRYNGGRAELLLLPLEGHSYRARESVLQTAGAMLDWFDQYLKQENDDDALRNIGLANASP
jgi:dipeptidyl aminopeptidase/acylaminoacyl peptidase